MARLEIRQYPDPVLREVCERVDRFDDDIRKLARDMLDTMYLAGGRGLAAPQVGVPIQLFVMDPGWKSGMQTTLPFDAIFSRTWDRPVIVTRPARVLLGWHDLHDQAHQEELTGDAAVVAQHETDHLEGRLCIDYGDTP